MDTDPTASGDPRRSVEMLWRRGEPGRRGPKQRLSTEEVVRAAVRVADTEGVQALSMRKIAKTFGLSPMSLYTYVPSKAELLDLMVDQVLGEAADPDDSIVGWRARLAFGARQRWELTERHPWLLDLALHRPPLGPNVVRKVEVMLRTLEGMGLNEWETAMVAEALHNYVAGALHSARQAREVEHRTGVTDEEWLSNLGPLLEGRVGARDYPAMRRLSLASRARTSAGGDREARFEFGLERMLDGLEAFIRRRQGDLARRPCSD